jgi:hypothetical protein
LTRAPDLPWSMDYRPWTFSSGLSVFPDFRAKINLNNFLTIFVMYLEAKETARLYKLLSEKLGNDTAEAMFKYIDNKTERSVEATIKTLATKDDIANVRKEINEAKAENIKWMFIFWIGNVGAMLAIALLILKK